MYVYTCMLRPASFPGAWSSWHLQVACLHPKCWTIYFTTSICHFNQLFIARASVAGGTVRYAKRRVQSTPWHIVSKSDDYSIIAKTKPPGLLGWGMRPNLNVARCATRAQHGDACTHARSSRYCLLKTAVPLG